MAQVLYEFVEQAAEVMQYAIPVIGDLTQRERAIVNAQMQAIYLMDTASRDKHSINAIDLQSKTSSEASPSEKYGVWFKLKRKKLSCFCIAIWDRNTKSWKNPLTC